MEDKMKNINKDDGRDTTKVFPMPAEKKATPEENSPVIDETSEFLKGLGLTNTCNKDHNVLDNYSESAQPDQISKNRNLSISTTKRNHQFSKITKPHVSLGFNFDDLLDSFPNRYHKSKRVDYDLIKLIFKLQERLKRPKRSIFEGNVIIKNRLRRRPEINYNIDNIIRENCIRKSIQKKLKPNRRNTKNWYSVSSKIRTLLNSGNRSVNILQETYIHSNKFNIFNILLQPTKNKPAKRKINTNKHEINYKRLSLKHHRDVPPALASPK